MKNISQKIALNCILVVFMTFGASSCKLFDAAPETHYYSFNNNDEKWLLGNLKKDDIVTYVNSKNEKIVFKVLYSEATYREEYVVGRTLKSDGTKRFEFDIKKISLSCISIRYIKLTQIYTFAVYFLLHNAS